MATDSAKEPWKSWPRLPGGFLDLGYDFPFFYSLPCRLFRHRCGNGLLTHILTAGGYEGSALRR